VTQETSFLSAGVLNTTNAESAGGDHLFAAGAELNNSTADAPGADLKLTWKSFAPDPAKPIFVVIYVEDNGVCTTQNMKIYKIDPQNAFTLDISNVDATGAAAAYATLISSCFANIASAIYDPTGDGGKGAVTYDYGTNYLFYEVTAANFNDSWRPTFRLSGLDAAQKATIDWAYASAPSTWSTATAPAGNNNGDYTVTKVDAQSGNKLVGTSGETILVRVKIENQKFEGTAIEPITLAVDGETALDLATPIKDVADAGADCGKDDGFTNDLATQNLTPRPSVTSATVGAGTPTMPNPGPFVPAN
jgi:hypothetical protein